MPYPLQGIPEVEMSFDLNDAGSEAVRRLMGQADGLATSVRMSVMSSRQSWQFPKERFVEYDASDEDWCRYFVIGQEVTVVDEFVMQDAYLVPTGQNSFKATPLSVNVLRSNVVDP